MYECIHGCVCVYVEVGRQLGLFVCVYICVCVSVCVCLQIRLCTSVVYVYCVTLCKQSVYSSHLESV